MILESIEHARKVQAILHTAWWSAWCAKAEKVDPESYRLIQSALERVETEAIERFGHNEEHPDCTQCKRYSVFGGPDHDASRRCKSGRKPHCSCDTCY